MPPYSLRRLFWAGPIATLAAILAGVLYYALTKVLGEQYLLPLDGSSSQLGQMPVLTPITAILILGLLASIFFGLLLRFSRKPATVFLSISITALLLSFGGPFSLPAASMQTKILMSGMQVIAAGTITGGIMLLSHKDAKVP
jgi:L-asparagine transporter-like permease